MRRREFLRSACAAIVPAAIPSLRWGPVSLGDGARSAQEKSRTFAPITAVVYDDRYADCKAFADALARRGARAFGTNADAAQLWYGPLRTHVAQNLGRIAGLTTYADFSVSQACGRELNFAQVYEGEHDGRRSRANLAHRLRSRGDDREIAAALSGASWATQLADALSRTAIQAGDSRATPGSAEANTPRSAGHPGYLSSWLLIPTVTA
jgi:hypothetical protein